MKKELEHFYIGPDYGGNQDKVHNFVMRMGGCAAVTACDICICLDRDFGTQLSPCQQGSVTEDDYERFLLKMKPYLRPRMQGIDRLEIYMDGFAEYMHDQGEYGISLSGYDAQHKVTEGAEVIRSQIDLGFPVPYLLLRHRDKELDDYAWHWFLVNGYEETKEDFWVKVTTYGEWRWFRLAHLWETGYERRGGLILLKRERAIGRTGKEENIADGERRMG